MKNIVVGILAHVDAGKTTLSEGLLYSSGAIDRLGRVDKRDAFLDTHSLERERGITIFSKMAIIDYLDTHITLLDTPGHIDFCAETERTLSVQDYAILVISATDGITPHTKNLWQMLSDRHIPTFIFINKCDISQRRRDELLAEVRVMLSGGCVSFTDDGSPDFFEAAASTDTELMDEFFNTETLGVDSIRNAIRKRHIFPCIFGSALKLEGVKRLLEVIDKYTVATEYSEKLFGARVYKIAEDRDGRRVAFAKITGGELTPKSEISFKNKRGDTVREKIEEIRVFSSDKSKPVKRAERGTVVGLYGTKELEVGTGLGTEPNDSSILSPVLDYRIILPSDVNPHEAYMKIKALAEEDPALGIKYSAEAKEIRVSLMGEIQLEVLRTLIKNRFGIDASFDEGEILYKETVADTVYGYGHFEPLRHYSEVHLRIDPLPEGSGIVAATECPTDTLALSWQRLVLTHIEERVHKGVLLGSPLTDVKITLVNGRAHVKHTDGGDFRQATYRAIRQGLMKANSVVLEPTFDFVIELPLAYVGKALTDISNMHGEVISHKTLPDSALLEGSCPVATMRGYPTQLRAYTKGEGKITLTVGEYAPCHNSEEVIEKRGYNPDLDEGNTAGSVFCKAGAGYVVPWYEAEEKMHLPLQGKADGEKDEGTVPKRARAISYHGTLEEDKELMRIFESTYGKVKPRTVSEKKENAAPTPKKERTGKPVKPGDEYLIIDGYNVIFALSGRELSGEVDFSLERELLIRAMCSYSAFRKCKVIIVFDAYKRKDGAGSIEKCGNVTVVYTKEKQTADSYIERATYEIAPKSRVRVVTSDRDEQFVILGNGALRMSIKEFTEELEGSESEMKELLKKAQWIVK